MTQAMHQGAKKASPETFRQTRLALPIDKNEASLFRPWYWRESNKAFNLRSGFHWGKLALRQTRLTAAQASYLFDPLEWRWLVG